MISKHCGVYLKTIEDSCIRMIKRCSECQETFTQRKRRPAHVRPDKCSWIIDCPEHPTGILNDY